jgi:hypothetical protein
MTYTMTSKISDKLLFCDSTVGIMVDDYYRLRISFVNDLLASFDARAFAFIVGKAMKR